MKADPLFREKRLAFNRRTGQAAVAELKVWKVPKSDHEASLLADFWDLVRKTGFEP